MEVQTLFDRAFVDTESSLVDNNLGIDPVRECIQRNLVHLDLIVFDLRHLEIDLNQILKNELTRNTRVILMHYDRGTDAAIDLPETEFISVITTSRALAMQLVRASPASAIDQPGDSHPSLAQVKTVLLVDDNQVNLKLAGELIRLWGHQVVEADHADEALELYKNQHFDLIILDIQMPDIDGPTLLKMMREHEPGDTTPVVALTANILNQEAQRLLDLGFDYYLSKPIDEEKFRSLLDGDLRQRSQDTHNADSDPDSMTDISVDYDQSLALSASKQALLRQTFEILLLEIPDHQQQLMDALEKSRHDKLAEITHKLHGITCYLSLPRLKQMVLALQWHLDQDSNNSLPLAVQDITGELLTIRIKVEEYLLDMEG
jgi:two-component system sensor histidine kinase BarA